MALTRWRQHAPNRWALSGGSNFGGATAPRWRRRGWQPVGLNPTATGFSRAQRYRCAGRFGGARWQTKVKVKVDWSVYRRMRLSDAGTLVRR